MKKISREDVMAWALGELDAEAAAPVERALAASAALAADAEAARALVAALRNDALPVPPPRTVQRAAALLAERRPSRLAAWLDRARQYVADLVIDTRRRPVTAGFRGDGGSFHFAWACEAATVDVGVSRAAGGWRLRGHVTPQSGERALAAALLRAGTREAAAAAAPDDAGHFALQVEDGTYDLLVGLNHGTVVAPGLDLG